MPSFFLTEIAEARLDALSFFIAAFLLCAWGLKWAWNVLARDFEWMPVLKCRQAVAALVVSGLFVYVALTLIAGARELMTPGAWNRVGATHQLAYPEKEPAPWLEAGRKMALERLRDALWLYAKENEGNLPPSAELAPLDESHWIGMHPQGERFAYVASVLPGKGQSIVAYETDGYGPTRFALLADGSIRRFREEALKKALALQFGGGGDL